MVERREGGVYRPGVVNTRWITGETLYSVGERNETDRNKQCSWRASVNE